MGAFFANLWNKYLNPAIGYLWHYVGGAITGAILPSLAQSAMSGKLTVGGGVATVVSGVVGALVGAAQHSNNQTVAAAAGTITPDQQAAIDAQISAKVTQALSKAAPVVAKVVLLLALFLFARPGFANPIGVPLNPPAQGETDFLVQPFTGINANFSEKNDYGLAFAYGISYSKVTPVDATHVLIDPYCFLAPYIEANVGEWVASNGASAIILNYGLMVGLPKLDATIPELGFTLNRSTLTGDKTTVGVVASWPTDILADVLVGKINL